MLFQGTVWVSGLLFVLACVLGHCKIRSMVGYLCAAKMLLPMCDYIKWFGIFSEILFFTLLLHFARQYLSSQNEQLCYKELLKLKASCIFSIAL